MRFQQQAVCHVAPCEVGCCLHADKPTHPVLSLLHTYRDIYMIFDVFVTYEGVLMIHITASHL